MTADNRNFDRFLQQSDYNKIICNPNKLKSIIQPSTEINHHFKKNITGSPLPLWTILFDAYILMPKSSRKRAVTNIGDEF